VAIGYAGASWIVEGDIESCYDSIPHGRLVEQLRRRIADEKVLQLIWRFLEAGYLEDWKFHKTYSGVPQGNILGPLLCNVFLHQLDEFIVAEYSANQPQTERELVARRNPEYGRISCKITRLRRKRNRGEISEETATRLKELLRQRKSIPSLDKEKRQRCRVKYVRYADDWLILVAGGKQEAEAIKQRVKEKLSSVGLRLSEEKTKTTHWSQSVRFLGYDIGGKLRDRGVGVYAVLSIPNEKLRKVEKALEQRSSYYQIPELDVMMQLSVVYCGWCNYYRYANNASRDFGTLAREVWWSYAHFLGRKQKSSIKQMIIRERKAGRLGSVQRGERNRNTFSLPVGKKRWVLNLFPPKRISIRTVTGKQKWEVDLQPFQPMNWQSGRSYATRLEAMERAEGVCERCKGRSATQVHHKVGLRGRSLQARLSSDQDQRNEAIALCDECHLEVHGGNFRPGRKRSVQSAEIR
jgi:hypothetical protein